MRIVPDRRDAPGPVQMLLRAGPVALVVALASAPAIAVPPPLPIPAAPAAPTGGGWQGTVTSTEVRHFVDTVHHFGPMTREARTSVRWVTAGDPGPAPVIGTLSPLVGAVTHRSSESSPNTCEGGDTVGDETGPGHLVVDTAELDETGGAPGGVLQVSFSASMEFTLSTTQRIAPDTSAAYPCRTEVGSGLNGALAALPLQQIELAADGGFAGSHVDRWGWRTETAGRFTSAGGRDVFTGVQVLTRFPDRVGLTDVARLEWSLSCPTGTCVRRYRSSDAERRPDPDPFPPPTVIPDGGGYAALTGRPRRSGPGDVAIQCGRARFDWYASTRRPGVARAGDRVCVHVLSNDLSREMWRATRAGGGSLTRVYRDEIARAATAGAAEAAIRTGALYGTRRAFAAMIPQAATTLGKVNLVFTGGNAIGWAGIATGYSTALSKITRGRSCFAFTTITRGGRTTVADVRFLFGVSDLRNPRRDAPMSVFATRDREQRRGPDRFHTERLGVSCGAGGFALAGPLWDTGRVLSSPSRWVAGRGDLSAAGIPY